MFVSGSRKDKFLKYFDKIRITRVIRVLTKITCTDSIQVAQPGIEPGSKV